LYLAKAERFFNYVERTLTDFPPTPRGKPTKSLCRPVILLMNHGWSRAWWQAHPETSAPAPAVNVTPEQFGTWAMSTPQKQVAIRRAKLIIKAGAVAFLLSIIALVVALLLSLSK
jgi:hypothetical protein